MDKYPAESPTSNLETSPPPTSSSVLRRRPAYMQQVGYAAPYTSKGESLQRAYKPSYYEFAAWDEARKFEPIIKRGLELIRLHIVAKIGPYSHPNAAIQKFVRANIQTNLASWISTIASNSFTFGFGVSETIYKWKEGPGGIPQLWLDTLVPYHSSQVTLLLNNYGVLTDGDDIIGNSLYKSGIWVQAPSTALLEKKNNLFKNKDRVGNLVRLPKGKYFYVCNSIDGANPYGTSLIESIIKYYLYKSVFSDMMTTALDRYGTPLIYVKVPPQNTGEVVTQADGSVRPKTLQEVTEEQLKELSSNTALVFTQVSKDQPVEVEALTTGNNFADSFQQAIELCDSNMLQGLGIPNLLMKEGGSRMGSGAASTKQMEVFDMQVTSYYNQIMNSFLEKVIRPLIQYNFDPKLYADSYLDGTFSIKPTRPEEVAATIDAIEALTNTAFLSPSNDEHREWVSQVIGFPFVPYKESELLPSIRTPKAPPTPNNGTQQSL